MACSLCASHSLRVALLSQGTIQDRALHLQSFLDGYAALARIPEPQRVSVSWGPFLDGLRGFWPGLEIGEAPSRPAFFDRAQIQQVLINLIKNAHEVGGPNGEVKVAIETGTDGGCRISVLDRGPGISDEVHVERLSPVLHDETNRQ